MTQLEKEQLAPNYWNVVKVWNNNPNDEQLLRLEQRLNKDEKFYFEFHKQATKLTKEFQK
jgi:RNA binding exosome subunit